MRERCIEYGLTGWALKVDCLGSGSCSVTIEPRDLRDVTLSGPLFVYMQNGDNNSTYLVGMLDEVLSPAPGIVWLVHEGTALTTSMLTASKKRVT